MKSDSVKSGLHWSNPKVWKKGDKARLELACEGENLHIRLSAVHGHPEHPHFPDPPASTSPPPSKKKFLSQLRHQERRRKEALVKAGGAKVVEEDISEKVFSDQNAKTLTDVEKTTEKSLELQEDEDIHKTSLNEYLLKCSHCYVTSKSETGLKIHVVKSHKIVLLKTPEKEHSDPFLEEPSFTLTPNKLTREEETTGQCKCNVM